MHRPKLSDKKCKELSEALGIDLFNAKAHDGDVLTIRGEYGFTTIDTAHSFGKDDTSYGPIVKKFDKSVLILGLGFGRAVIEACNNPRVKKVVAIEINKGVKEVFFAVHGKKFSGFEKLTVIVKDAFEYKETKFDHVFIDFIHDVVDKEKYLKDMQILRDRFKKSNVHFIDLY